MRGWSGQSGRYREAAPAPDRPCCPGLTSRLGPVRLTVTQSRKTMRPTVDNANWASTIRRWSLTALVVIGALPVGCQRGASSPASPAESKTAAPYKFVVVSHATAVPFFVPVRKGVEEAGKLL